MSKRKGKKWHGITIHNPYRKRTDDLPPPHPARPKTRGDCHRDSGTMNAQRPCPWVSCKYHLLLEVSDVGTIRSPHRTLEKALDKIDTCALDIADDVHDRAMGEVRDDALNNRDVGSARRIGKIFGITDKAVHMIIERVIKKLRDTT